ncbi:MULTISPECIES: DUF7424 family protein [unclassified Gilliamella]|uniref:DUF7424 family protein n=1 Tax=unclassified Gilliamella TaxID=2685620 RepID=UPI002269A050|nr:MULTISPECIES: hypothetical protein [unclassified Gilliamella]MCX8584058.1 hypothetical protein [Gilliamella sp. B3372]MCX8594725.1 hypothetical protein [Gilliamella sp. B3367]
MKKLLVLLSCCVLLSACKVELSPSVNLSDLSSETPKIIKSDLTLEVTACGDYQDSRKESSSLIEAKQKITEIFPNAEYVECYKEKFDSKALFKIPVVVGGKQPSGDIQITNGNWGDGMIVLVSKELSNKMNNMKKSPVGKLDFDIKINLNNDSGNERNITANGVYIDENPVLLNQYVLQKGNNTFRLSNVSVDFLLKNNITFIYEDYKKKGETQ